MARQKREKIDYPLNEWEIVEECFEPGNIHKNESIFATGNGYIGLRGNFEEGNPSPRIMGVEGTYINGFYEISPMQYGEKAYGFPEKNQTMLNVTNGKIIKLFLEDEEFNMTKGEMVSYRRSLNLKEGYLRRNIIWISPQGRKIKLDIIRLVSFTNKYLVVINYKVTPLNFDGVIKLVSALDGNIQNLTAEADPRVGSGLKRKTLEVESVICEDDLGLLVQKTQRVKAKLACAMQNQLVTKGPFEIENRCFKTRVEVIYRVEAKQERPVVLNKYLAYTTSQELGENKVLFGAMKIATQARSQGFSKILKAQKDYLERFWDKSDLVIKGDPGIQQGIRFNMFHLLQSAGKDGKTNIAAKGLTGEGYEGHYFWDTEMYIMPFFLYTNPEINRKLLEYRYHTLEQARARARQMSHPRGALFPWRTINGEECSAYFPAGTAQYHINADIAFAIKRYLEGTGDWDFMVSYGAELLFETARLWTDLGGFIPKRDNRFCINGVTGPDEYTAIVNNNFYTNLMAAENLAYAHQVAQWMKHNRTEDYLSLAAKIGLEETELEHWKKAAQNIYLPYDPELGLYAQDDSFFAKEVWSEDKELKRPMLLHYHPLVIYRYQVCKQADVVLALFLLGQRFELEEKKRNFDYYEKITTHDSSLSECIFSIVASDIGYHDKAYQYFLDSIRMDLDNLQGNTSAGNHIANMAGSWMMVINGFAGMRVYDDVLSFKPHLPKEWNEYSFKITYRGKVVKLTINQQGTKYELLEGDELAILHNGEERILKNIYPALIC